MAEHKYEQLKEMTVAGLREIAQGVQDDTLEGFSTMHKEQLLPLLCKALKVEVHHAAKGSEKSQLKARIRQLRAERDKLLAGAERKALPEIRHQIHMLKHRLRKMALGA